MHLLKPVYALCSGGNKLVTEARKQRLHRPQARKQKRVGLGILRHASTFAQRLDQHRSCCINFMSQYASMLPG